MVQKLNLNDYVRRNEFDSYRIETSKNFDKVFTGLDSTKKELDSINKDVNGIKLQTAVIETRVDSILDSIENMGKNIDTHFSLIKEASSAREESNILKMENLIEENIKNEWAKHEVATPPKEDKDEDDDKNSVKALVVTGLTGVIVALVQVLPKLLGK